MNTNWSKILLFSLISFALGVIICCLCCHMCGGGGCGREGSCGGGGSCMHGEHGGMSCCMGEGHGMGDCMHGKGGMEGHKGKGACCSMGHGDAEAHAAIEKIKASNFEGDTTVAIEGGTVKIHKMGDDLKVQVEMTDSARVEEKTVEVHGH